MGGLARNTVSRLLHGGPGSAAAWKCDMSSSPSGGSRVGFFAVRPRLRGCLSPAVRTPRSLHRAPWPLWTSQHFLTAKPKVLLPLQNTFDSTAPKCVRRKLQISSGQDGYTASQSGTKPGRRKHRGSVRIGKQNSPLCNRIRRFRRCIGTLTLVATSVRRASITCPRRS